MFDHGVTASWYVLYQYQSVPALVFLAQILKECSCTRQALLLYDEALRLMNDNNINLTLTIVHMQEVSIWICSLLASSLGFSFFPQSMSSCFALCNLYQICALYQQAFDRIKRCLVAHLQVPFNHKYYFEKLSL